MEVEITLRVDGIEHTLTADTRTTVLDALQCGACTVLLEGKRANSCLALAVAHQGADIVTAAGLARDGNVHPRRRLFIQHDAFQCGYRTPGQMVSAVGMLREADCGSPSAVSGRRDGDDVALDQKEIRERMSGNLCRCGAYANIVSAIAEVARR